MSSNSRLTTAAHALCWLELSRRRGKPTLTSAEIADSLLSHPVLVRRTLAPLRDAGLLNVVGRGPGTGWQLARPAEEISLRDVSQVLGDAPLFALHAHPPKQDCPVGFGVPQILFDVYASCSSLPARARMSKGPSGETFARHSIADLLDRLLQDHPLPH